MLQFNLFQTCDQCVCLHATHRPVMEVPSGDPLPEEQARLYFRDIILGIEYCTYLTRVRCGDNGAEHQLKPLLKAYLQVTGTYCTSSHSKDNHSLNLSLLCVLCEMFGCTRSGFYCLIPKPFSKSSALF